MTSPSRGRFLSPRDISLQVDSVVMLLPPFWAFANAPRGPVELVMMTLSVDRAREVGTKPILLAEVATRDGRPLSLKVCGEGWIRIEAQLGRDVTNWSGGVVALTRGQKQGHDYIAVRELTKDQRRELFGDLA